MPISLNGINKNIPLKIIENQFKYIFSALIFAFVEILIFNDKLFIATIIFFFTIFGILRKFHDIYTSTILTFIFYNTYTFTVLLVLGKIDLTTLNNYDHQKIFLAISNFFIFVVYLLLSPGRQNRVTRFHKETIYGLCWLLPFIALTLMQENGFRNRWLYAGWDASGQHLAQVVGLLKEGRLIYNSAEGFIYPRAIHSVLAHLISLSDISNTPNSQILNSAMTMLLYGFWTFTALSLLALIRIAIFLANRFSFSNSEMLLCINLIGFVFVSDQFLPWSLFNGWLASLFNAFLTLVVVLLNLEENSAKRRMFMNSTLLILIINTWPIYALFVGIFLCRDMYTLLKHRSLNYLNYVLLNLIYVGLLTWPLLSETVKDYGSINSFNHRDFVPTFFWPLEVAILVGLLVLRFGSKSFKKAKIVFDFMAVTGFIIFPYFFAIYIQSPLYNMYYFPAKILWNSMLVALPFAIIGGLTFMAKLLNIKRSTFLNRVVVIVLILLLPISSGHGFGAFDSNLGRHEIRSKLIPRIDLEFLKSGEFLNNPGSKVVWNGDRYDFLFSYWLILSGNKTISPFVANQKDIISMCNFIKNNDNVYFFSRNIRYINYVEKNCLAKGLQMIHIK